MPFRGKPPGSGSGEMSRRTAALRPAIALDPAAATRARALRRQGLEPEAIAARFKRTPRAGVQAVLEALEELGMVVCEDGAYRLQG